MIHLTDAAVRSMQEMSWQLSTCATTAELEPAALRWLLEALPSESSAVADFTPGPTPMRMSLCPSEKSAAVENAVLNHLAAGRTDHPLMLYHFRAPQRITPTRLSDLISDRDFRRTAAYADVFATWNIHHQIYLVHRPHTETDGGAYALCRATRDFSDDELNLAIGLQPVLFALHQAISRTTNAARKEMTELFRLTPAELEVLQLLASGMTAISISHVRRVSPRTVRKQLEGIYAKLGYHDRMMAVQHATRLGMINSADARRHCIEFPEFARRGEP
jgi:DNA-binding CsgD family transcriptional regulator